MESSVSWLQIQPGWHVQSADGADLGEVQRALGDQQADVFNGLIVQRGLLGSDEAYVPAEPVSSIVEGRVHLSEQTPRFEELDSEGMPQGLDIE